MKKFQLAAKIWVKFCMNYPDIREIIRWMCEKNGEGKLMADHLFKKFCVWYDKSTSDGVMTRFYCELDSTYQRLLTEYAFEVWAPHEMSSTYEEYSKL